MGKRVMWTVISGLVGCYIHRVRLHSVGVDKVRVKGWVL